VRIPNLEGHVHGSANVLPLHTLVRPLLHVFRAPSTGEAIFQLFRKDLGSPCSILLGSHAVDRGVLTMPLINEHPVFVGLLGPASFVNYSRDLAIYGVMSIEVQPSVIVNARLEGALSLASRAVDGRMWARFEHRAMGQ
jgi:hypothetical protein